MAGASNRQGGIENRYKIYKWVFARAVVAFLLFAKSEIYKPSSGDQMVAYLRLLPILGLFLVDGARSGTVAHGAVDESLTGSSWEYVPGAYIIEYEDGHVSPILGVRATNHLRLSN